RDHEHCPNRPYVPILPPPKVVSAEHTYVARGGVGIDSTLCLGSIISGGHIHPSILAAIARVISVSLVVDTLHFVYGLVDRPAQVRRAIIDKGVHIPPGIEIGYDHEHDRARGFTVTESGVVVIAKADGVEHFAEAELATH